MLEEQVTEEIQINAPKIQEAKEQQTQLMDIAGVEELEGDIKIRELEKVAQCQTIATTLPQVSHEIRSREILTSEAVTSFDLQSSIAQLKLRTELSDAEKIQILQRIRTLAHSRENLVKEFGIIKVEQDQEPPVGFREWLNFREERDRLISQLAHDETTRDLIRQNSCLTNPNRQEGEELNLFSARQKSEMEQLGATHGNAITRHSIKTAEMEFLSKVTQAYDLSTPIDWRQVSEVVTEEYKTSIASIGKLSEQLATNKSYLSRVSSSAIHVLMAGIETQVSPILETMFDSDFYLSETVSSANYSNQAIKGDKLYSASSWITNSSEKVQELVEIRNNLSQLGSIAEQVVAKIDRAINQMRIVEAANHTLGSNPRTLWHGLGQNILLEKVIPSMQLQSRATQFETTGEAVFNSAGLTVNKSGENFTVLNNSTGKSDLVSSEELVEMRGLGNKSWFQEYHQLCFEADCPYMYVHDCAIVFPRNSVLVGNQFASIDGIHVFNPNFKGNINDPGFSIDLNSTPFVIAITLASKEQFEQGVRAKLGENADKFISDHVVYLERLNTVDSVQALNQRVQSMTQPKGSVHLLPQRIKYEASQGDFGKDLIYAKEIEQ